MCGCGWLPISVLVGQAVGPVHLPAVPASERSSDLSDHRKEILKVGEGSCFPVNQGVEDKNKIEKSQRIRLL